jgi:arginase family enzyme
MEISSFLNPVPAEVINKIEIFSPQSWGNYVDFFSNQESFPNLENKKIAIIGITEDRNAAFLQNAEDAPDAIRTYFYSLFPPFAYTRIVDLGNIKSGDTVEDTYYAIRFVVKELYEMDIVPLFFGGSQDITFSIYKAFEEMKKLINIVAVDSKLDMGTMDEPLNENSYLSKIVTQKPNYLFNFSNLAYQTYLNDFHIIALMNDFFFDIHRLGEIRTDIKVCESYMRNADVLSFDIASIREGDAPGQNFPSPNGLYAEEACQLAYYAGLSEKISVAGFYNFNSKLDRRGQTAHLIAQLLWHFVAGYIDRFYESPWQDSKQFVRYNVKLEHEMIVFYRSKESNRWWMEVDVPLSKQERYGKVFLVPCSDREYETAGQGDIPDLYFRTLQKMH